MSVRFLRSSDIFTIIEVIFTPIVAFGDTLVPRESSPKGTPPAFRSSDKIFRKFPIKEKEDKQYKSFFVILFSTKSSKLFLNIYEKIYFIASISSWLKKTNRTNSGTIIICFTEYNRPNRQIIWCSHSHHEELKSCILHNNQMGWIE